MTGMASMPPVVPRWEWRTFGDRFPAAEARLLAAAFDLKVSREIYIVCASSDANVKIRNDQIDVKRLQRVERDLELWSPVLKATFPIGADVVALVFEHWAMAPPALERPAYTLKEFLAEIVGPVRLLHAVDVAKERRGATIDGCAVEIAKLTVHVQTVETVAVEKDDPDRVLRTVRSLGLSGYRNENYVKALKRMLGVRPPDVHGCAPGGRLS